jgi:hypothetical protein
MKIIPFTAAELAATTLSDMTPEQLQAGLRRYVEMEGSYSERDEAIEEQAQKFLKDRK